MEPSKWQAQKVFGRDEVLREIEKRANAYCASVVQDARGVMHDYEVDMYRLVLSIGKHYGMETAYQIMSETVSEKRLRWLDQVMNELELSGTAVEKGLSLYLKYFKMKAEDIQIIEKEAGKVIFKRMDFVDAIFHACNLLGLDVVEVNNKVYARSMNLMFARINLEVNHAVLHYSDGWYEEMIELIPQNGE